MSLKNPNTHRKTEGYNQNNADAAGSSKHPSQYNRINVEASGAALQVCASQIYIMNCLTQLQGEYTSLFTEVATRPGLYFKNQASLGNISRPATVTPSGGFTDNREEQPRRPRFQQSMIRVHRYMREVTWQPISGTNGVPRTDEEAFSYVSEVGKAIADIRNVLDAPYCQSEFQRFSDSQWPSKDIHAMSHVIVSVAISLHERGATSIVFKKPFDSDVIDASLTFPERMEWFMKLLRQFKGFCDMIMRGAALQELLASAKFIYEDYCRQAEQFHRRMHFLQQNQQQQNSALIDALMTGAPWGVPTAGSSFPQPPEVNPAVLDPLLQGPYQLDHDFILVQEEDIQQSNMEIVNDGYIVPFQTEDH